MISQEGPEKDFYRDDFNDQSHNCTIGTSDEDERRKKEEGTKKEDGRTKEEGRKKEEDE